MLEKLPAVVFDIETTNTNVYAPNFEIFAYSTCTEQGAIEVYRFDRTATQRHYGQKRLLELWNNNQVAKVAHNAMYEISGLNEGGFSIPEYAPLHDTMVMSHLLRNLAPNHSLDYLAWELSGYSRELDEAVKAASKQVPTYKEIPEKLMREYQKADAERCMLLFLTFWPEIKKDSALLEDYKNEIAMLWVTRRLIKRGYRLKFEQVEKLMAWLEAEIIKTLAELNQAVGRNINPRSPKDLGWILFEFLKLPVVKFTEKGNPSTDAEAFEIWEQTEHNEIFNLIIKYRSYAGARSKINGYMRLCDSNGILRSNIGTDVAKTGRQSSSKPNLQNVDRPGDLSKKYPVPMRRLFGPRDGYVNIHIDYASLEALLLTHYSQDPEMLKIVRSGGDIHAEGAKLVFGEVWERANKATRKLLRFGTKGNVSFAIPYGSNIRTAEKELALHLPPGETRKPRLAPYLARFPKYCGLSGSTSAFARNHGYIVTAFGRRLWIPRNELYKSVNYLIQGTAAGIIKRAQVKVDPYLREVTDDAAGIILPIHDEIVIEWPRELLPEMKPILREVGRLMCDFGNTFSVPLGVEYEIVTNTWDRKKELVI